MGQDDIFFLGPRRHENHERFPQQFHEVINIFFSHRKKYILFSAIGPPPPGFNIGTAAVRGVSVILVTLQPHSFRSGPSKPAPVTYHYYDKLRVLTSFIYQYHIIYIPYIPRLKKGIIYRVIEYMVKKGYFWTSQQKMLSHLQICSK